MKLTHLWNWEVKLYAKAFRLATYFAYSPRLAIGEIIGLLKYLRDKFFFRTRRYDIEQGMGGQLK